MSYRRVVIYPFVQYKDWMVLRDNWARTRYEKIQKHPDREDLLDYEFFTFDQASKKKLGTGIKTLLGPDTVIYIIGHCAPGSRVLSHRGDMGATIDAFKLAQELAELGLNKNYAGKIKIYACNSAVSEQKKYPFAFWFAGCMKALDYLNCEVSGYTNTLSNGYLGEHKMAADDALLTRIEQLAESNEIAGASIDGNAVKDYRAKNSRQIIDVPSQVVDRIKDFFKIA